MPPEAPSRPFGNRRRRYPRFRLVATAKAFFPRRNWLLDNVSVHDVGMGGAGLYCGDTIAAGDEILVSLYSREANRTITAESIRGTVVSTVPWREPLTLVNISFQQPISPDFQPELYRRLIEMQAS